MPKPATLVERMKRLLGTAGGDDADVHFLVGGEILKAHKLILKSASDVFETMFRFDAENAKAAKRRKTTSDEIYSVEITDIEAGPFKVMLSYIYTDDLSGLNGDNTMEVLNAATKYNINGLIKACFAFPISKLSNVFIVAEQARFLEERAYAGRCIKYIDQNAASLIQSEAFLQVDQHLLCVLFGQNKLEIDDEITLWNAALRWADEKCRQKDKECTAENRRVELGPVLYEIRFPLIPKEEFSNKIVPCGVLTDQELVSVLLFHSNPNRAQSDLHPLPFSIEQRDSATERIKKSTGNLMMKIGNFSAFARGDGNNAIRRLSDATLHMAGFQFRIVAISKTDASTTEKSLGFYLECSNPSASKDDVKWSVNFSATLGIVARQKGAKDYCRTFSNVFSGDPGRGYTKFRSFDSLMDDRNGLICDDSVILSVDVTVDEQIDLVK